MLLSLLPVFLGSWPLLAAQQRVIVVDSGQGPQTDFITIQDAAFFATEGNVLLVRGGDYDTATVKGKGVVLLGDRSRKDAGPTVSVLVASQVPAESSVIIAGVRADGRKEPASPFGSTKTTPFTAFACLGPVSVERCLLSGPHGGFESTPTSSPVGGFSGARINDSQSMQLVDCLVWGGSGGTISHQCSTSAATALVVDESRIHVARSKFWGGHGVNHEVQIDCFPVCYESEPGRGCDVYAPATPALFVAAEMYGGQGGCNDWPPYGLLVSSGSADLVASTAINGHDDGPLGGPPDPDHPGTFGSVAEHSGPAFHTIATPLQYEQDRVGVGVSGALGDVVYLYAGFGRTAGMQLPGVLARWYIADPQLLGIAVLPPSGKWVLEFHVPELGPGVEAVVAHIQAAGLRLGGGSAPTILLSEARVVALLDAAFEIPGGEDCDDDGTFDLLAIEAGVTGDCNQNGVPDPCDIAAGLLLDANADGVPDSCDCNGNGVLDGDELASGAALDLDGDGLPDDCSG
jgi:hypothetical protein